MKIRFFSLLMLAGILLSGGCSQDDGLTDGGDPVVVSFTAGIYGTTIPAAKSGTRSTGFDGGAGSMQTITGVTDAGVPYADYVDEDGFQTRAFYPDRTTEQAANNSGLKTRTTAGGNEWVQNDGVGIFMVMANGQITNSTDCLADNKKHTITNTTTGEMAPDGGTPIYYPQSGTVDFVAYYPYGDKGTNAGQVNGSTYIYKVSVADQNAPAAIDVLYAKKEGVSKSKTVPVDLQFSHALSKITLNVTNGEGITAGDISGLTADKVVFKGMPIEASIALQDGTVTAGSDLSQTFNPLKATAPPSGYQATFSAILVPQAGTSGRTVTFTAGGTPYIWTIPNSDVFSSGRHYTYTITVKQSGIEVSPVTISKWNENNNGTSEVEILAMKVKAGTFQMGSPTNEPDRHPDETQHSVTLTKDFYMSRYQVTHAQYAAFLNSNTIGSDGKGDVSYDKDGSSVVEENQTFIYEHALGVKYESGKWVA
ncbi:MAG: fimbrillin family protein, partial [Tannerellaceae bacterium]|nr:fimbrillin family protein [Tannerellaceae bacterium]